MSLSKALKFSLLVIMLATLGVGQRKAMDERKTVPLLGKEGPFGETSGSSQQKEAASAKVRPISITTSGIAGSLAIHMMRDPSFSSFSRGLSGADRYLGLRLTGDEWGALFLITLGCPDVTDVPRLADEDRDEWERRYSLRFQEAIPDFPTLARVWDVFIYVGFKPEEIGKLRNECRRIQSNTSDEKTRLALTKLLRACDEASNHQSGLLFVPD